MFTSKKLLIAALFFSAIQNLILANNTDNDMMDILNKIAANLDKKLEYLDKADKLIENPKNAEEKLVVKIGQLIRERKNIHRELVQQVDLVAAEKEIDIVNIVKNLKQIKSLKQQALNMISLIAQHASPERAVKLTEIIKKNLQELQYLKVLSYELLDLTDSKRINNLENTVNLQGNSIAKLYFRLGFIIPFVTVGFAAGLHAFFKTIRS